MSIALFLQIDHLGADVTDGTAFIGHVAHRHIADRRELAIGIQDDMDITIEHTRHTGGIGNDGGDLVEIELMERHGKVLQGRRIGILGEDAHTHAVVGA